MPSVTRTVPAIGERVCAVKGKVKAVEKRGHNRHGGYKHATIDDVYEATRKILAEEMLDLRYDVIERTATQVQTKSGVSNYITFKVKVGFVCGYTGQEEPKDTRYATVPFSGAMSDAAAGSFILKSWLRERLQIPTGDFPDESHLSLGSDMAETIGETDRQWILDAIDRTKSDAAKFLEVFGIKSVDQMPVARLAEAKKMLAAKEAKAKSEARPDEA